MKDYDGSINIDSHVDTEGFNKDLVKIVDLANKVAKGISSGLAGVWQVIQKGLVAVLNGAVITVGVLIGLFALLAATVSSIIAGMIGLWNASKKLVTEMVAAMDSTTGYAKQVQHVKDLFDSVKMATYAAFAPLIEFALPYLEKIVHVLVVVFNTIAMIIASILGMAKVWQYVEGSTKKATGAAKGALAAFDQINVLQQAQGQNIGAGKFVQVDVDPDIIQKTWDKIVQFLKDSWEAFRFWLQAKWQQFCDWFWSTDLGKGIKKAWDYLVVLWGQLSLWWYTNVTKPLMDWITLAWDWVKLKATEAWDWLVNTWWNASTWWYENVTKPLIDWVTYWATWWGIVLWDAFLLFTTIWIKASVWWWENVIWPLIKWWLYWGTAIGLAIIAGWFKLVEIWGKASTWWKTNITDKFIEHIDNFVKHLKYAFGSGFAIAANIVIGFANSVIKAMNTVMSTAAVMWNVLIHAANSAGQFITGWKTIPDLVAPVIKLIPEIAMPKLASGAVIPPNAQFAAILGDNKSQSEILAPEDLIRKIVREETGDLGSNVTVNFTGSMAQLVRILQPEITKETNRIGTSLISGGLTA